MDEQIEPQTFDANNVVSEGTDTNVTPTNDSQFAEGESPVAGSTDFQSGQVVQTAANVNPRVSKAWLKWVIAGAITVIIFAGVVYYLYGTSGLGHSKTGESSSTSDNDAVTENTYCNNINKIADISKDLELSDHYIYKLLSLKGSQTADHLPYCLPNGDKVEFWLQGDGAVFKNVNNATTLDQAVSDYASWQSEMNKKKVVSSVEKISNGVYLYGLQSNFSTEYTIWIVSNISSDYPLGDAADNDTDNPSNFAITIEGTNSGKYNSEVLDLTKKIAKSVVVKW